MWYEIIPSYMIIVIAIALPHVSAYGINYLLVGNCYRRSLYTLAERKQYLRDRRLITNPSTSPYNVVTLAGVPDPVTICVVE
ncbi:hypothetical protein RN001_012605 [Aquatica leii]|uniref:NADH-ubiquinone oxidoreductase MWFE subunit n=1 Tax=Aquatica leii TaxID=1421715 RepID=A0AAN7QFE8_9COLE|nr:hypothetical protein RN001_012605 [Aquatica leii]